MRTYITTEIINGKPTVVTNHVGDAACGMVGQGVDVRRGLVGDIYTADPCRVPSQNDNYSPWKIFKALFTDKI